MGFWCYVKLLSFLCKVTDRHALIFQHYIDWSVGLKLQISTKDQVAVGVE